MTTTEQPAPSPAEDGTARATTPAASPVPANPLAQRLSADNLSLGDAIGGWRGLLDIGLPGWAFVTVNAVTQQLWLSIWSAVGLALLLVVVRLIRRETVQQSIGGLFGVAISAYVASRTGRPEDYFLPGFWTNVAYGIVLILSTLVRWPLVGVLVGPVVGEWFSWRQNPARRRAYLICTWIWVGLFAARLAIQVPLYQAKEIVALGYVRGVMSAPLFGLMVYVCWLILKRVPTTPVPSPFDKPEPVGGEPAERD